MGPGWQSLRDYLVDVNDYYEGDSESISDEEAVKNPAVATPSDSDSDQAVTDAIYKWNAQA